MLIYISDFDSKQREDITNISMENNVTENKDSLGFRFNSILRWNTRAPEKLSHWKQSPRAVNERFSFN